MATRSQVIREVREEKLKNLRDLGINPYPSRIEIKGEVISISDAINSLGKKVLVAGRVSAMRSHGAVIFADIKDWQAKIQLLFQEKLLDKKFGIAKLVDEGDFLAVSGEVTKTQAGEVTINVSEFQILSKALRPIPSEWYGLKDIEERYRKRYLDLLLNPEVRERFNIRTKVVRGTRNYLDNLGYWEVETPTLQALYGGANAKPFKTHINALNEDFYLRIADELYLKRLVAGGYDRVYEICKDFRNEGVDLSHNPEFTMIEWYEAYADYHRVMDVTEGLFKHLAKEIFGDTTLEVGEHKIDIGKKWKRTTMIDVIKEKIGLDVNKEDEKGLIKYCKENGIELVGGESKGQLIFTIFEHKIGNTLIEPTWVLDYPKEVSPLSKDKPDAPGWVERFEGYIGGKEICDGWSELTDPAEQRKRFESDKKAARRDKEEAQQVDEDFIEAMEYGMPPIGGIGIGIDRLTMFFTNTWSIKEVIMFPTMRPLARDKSDQKQFKKQKSYRTELGRLEVLGEISEDIKKNFSGISYAFTIIEDVEIKKSDKKLEKFKKDIFEDKKGITIEEVKSIPSIKVYREMLKKTKVDVGSRMPSPEALLKRVVNGKGIYNINTAVDAYNLAVLETGIGLGGFDFEKITPPITLRFSEKDEEMLLLGDDEVTKTKDGEIVYSDNDKLLTLDLNYRDIDETKITLGTTHIILFADGGPGINPEDVKNALERGANYIQKFCGGKVNKVVLVQ